MVSLKLSIFFIDYSHCYALYYFTQKTNAPGTNFSSNAIEVLKKAQPQTQWATKVETAFNRCIASVSSEYFESRSSPNVKLNPANMFF
jgi:hypothetical protein